MSDSSPVKARGRNGGRPKTSEESSKRQSPCVTWDFTAWCSRTGEEPYAFFTTLKKHFKSCTWSLEKAPTTGALHWQGRGNLFKKLRESKESAEIANELGFAYFKPTSKDNVNNCSYQEKAASHVAGPWDFKNPPPLKTSDVSYIESCLHELPFLQELIKMLEAPIDPRQIIWIYDEIGNSKKSASQAYLSYKGLLEILPFVDNHKDLLQFAYGFAHKRAYGINIARGCAPKDDRERKEFASFIAGLESLKDGFVYDIRNYAKKEYMERPHVVVFANCKPIFDSATRDRWKLLRINECMEFQDITEQVLKDHDAYMAMRRVEWDRKTVMKEMKFEAKWDQFAAKHDDAINRVEQLERLREERAKRQAEALEQREACSKRSKDDASTTASSSSNYVGFPTNVLAPVGLPACPPESPEPGHAWVFWFGEGWKQIPVNVSSKFPWSHNQEKALFDFEEQA